MHYIIQYTTKYKIVIVIAKRNVQCSSIGSKTTVNGNVEYCGRWPSAFLNVFLAVTICDTQVVQSLLQQVSVSTNAFASRLPLAALQQFICNKGLVLLQSFDCVPKRWILVSNQLLKPAIPAFAYVVSTFLVVQSLRVHVPRGDREQWRSATQA